MDRDILQSWKLPMMVILLTLIHITKGQDCSGKHFYCNTKTTFQQCVGNFASGPVETCPAKTFCNMACPEVCSTTFSCPLPTTEPPALEACNTHGFYCVNDTAFKQCVDGRPTSGAVVSCPAKTFCNMACPEVCSTTFSCPLPTTEPPALEACNTHGFYCVNESHFQDCIDDNPPSDLINMCVNSTQCNMNCALSCDLDTAKCLAPLPPPFRCEETGKFPDGYNCSNYFLCISKSDGSFNDYNYTCPQGSRFNPTTLKCSLKENFSCAEPTTPAPPACNDHGFYCLNATAAQLCADDGIPPSEDVYVCNEHNYCSMDCLYSCSDTPHCMPTPSELTLSQFLCEAQGKFADSYNCSNYHMCFPDCSGGFLHVRYTCPEGSTFHSGLGICSAQVNSDCRSTNVSIFQCPYAGRFRDKTNCSQYHLCVAREDGTFYDTLYACPAGAIFSYESGRCTTNTDAMCDAKLTFSQSNICQERGIFPSPENCAEFHLCSENPFGGYYTYVYSCPDGSVFNADTEKCALTYSGCVV